MAIELINRGAAENDGTGDPLRTAFGKVNDNITKLVAKRGTVDPVGSLTPDFVGQFYTETTGRTLWQSTGLTNVDWEQIV